MIVFSINHTNYKNLIADFARLLNIKPLKSDVLELPPHIGSGYVKAMELQPELHVLIVDATWAQPLVTKRDKSSKTDFILHFDDVYVNTTASLRVDDELLQKSNTRHSVARLTSNLFFNMEEVPANMHIKSIKVMFTEGWLKKYLGLDKSESVIQQYLSLKTESFDIEKLDEGYFKLMNELCHVSDDAPLRQIYVMNRVNLLIERFFRRLYGKMRLLKGEFNLSEDDVQRLIKVEKILTDDFKQLPPTIDRLAKTVSMSATKLKVNFKQMYGQSIYAYFQKARLQKARQLLIEGKKTVTKVAEEVGYNSTSNFILAFKKQYGHLPGDLIT